MNWGWTRIDWRAGWVPLPVAMHAGRTVFELNSFISVKDLITNLYKNSDKYFVVLCDTLSLCVFVSRSQTCWQSWLMREARVSQRPSCWRLRLQRDSAWRRTWRIYRHIYTLIKTHSVLFKKFKFQCDWQALILIPVLIYTFQAKFDAVKKQLESQEMEVMEARLMKTSELNGELDDDDDAG